MNECVRVKELSIRFRKMRAVNEVSLAVQSGDVHILLGHSGSGKSTLLRGIAGLQQIDSGSIQIEGQEMANPSCFVPPERRPEGMVFQDFALFPNLTLLRNVMFGMRGQARLSRKASAIEWLARVGLDDRAKDYPHELSGGEQQRVALVRALARGPKVMLLDEPFSGLDTALRDQVRSMTVRVLRQSDVATILVTHDPMEALAIGDQVSVMERGKIIVSGSPKSVIEEKAEKAADLFWGIQMQRHTDHDRYVVTRSLDVVTRDVN